MKQKIMMLFLAIIMGYTFTIPIVNVQAAQTLTNNATGTIDGYDYELWKDSGTTSMTLNGGGKFSCSWSNINNALFRIGKKLGETQTYQQLGNIVETYGCNYQPNGNSYLAIYGWTTNPLVEYYIIESYGTWRPPGNDKPLKGTITVDGGTYEVYQNSRTGPSIKGDTTFQQYWSVRTSKRTSGTISVSDHFKAWESKYGMQMGKMYEVSLVVEGYQSSGSADVYSNTLTIGGNPTPTPSTGPNPTPTQSIGPTPTPTPTPTVTVIQGNYAVTYNVQSSWGTGGTVNVTIKNNTSTPVNGWTLAFAFPSGQTITNLWNGSYTQSGASASVKNASYNAAIGAGGGSVSFGFNYNGSGGNPTSFTLNGAACTVQ
jgi:endo-1,4-beta-xylanase